MCGKTGLVTRAHFLRINSWRRSRKRPSIVVFGGNKWAGPEVNKSGGGAGRAPAPSSNVPDSGGRPEEQLTWKQPPRSGHAWRSLQFQPASHRPEAATRRRASPATKFSPTPTDTPLNVGRRELEGRITHVFFNRSELSDY